MENTDWKLVYSTNRIYKADILMEILAEKGIKSQSINKKGSMLPVGFVEIYVLPEDLEKAKDIVEKHPEL